MHRLYKLGLYNFMFVLVNETLHCVHMKIIIIVKEQKISVQYKS